MSHVQPGTATVQREHERVVNGRVIRIENTSTYRPQPKNQTEKCMKTLDL